MKLKVILSEEQKDFIRANNNRMKEQDIMKAMGISRSALQRFKRSENLTVYPRNRKAKVIPMGEEFFNVDAKENWV